MADLDNMDDIGFPPPKKWKSALRPGARVRWSGSDGAYLMRNHLYTVHEVLEDSGLTSAFSIADEDGQDMARRELRCHRWTLSSFLVLVPDSELQ